tara:strand:- start:1732 stop:3066 length:1335 start_codon:yes stop_codon:yes gene_type:complete
MAKTTITSKSSEPAFVSKIDVKSNKDGGKTVSLVGGFVELLYYESILQDSVKMDIVFTDTGNAIDKKSVLEGLPLVGTEEVNVAFEDNNENKIKIKLYVNKVTPGIQETERSITSISLVSEEFIRNELGSSKLNLRFDGKISDHIKKILKKFLKSKKVKDKDIETTSNNYNFIGNRKKAFYTMNWLSKYAIPEKEGKPGDTAGFFLFETSDGYKFKSIDSLFAQKKKKSFIFTRSPDAKGDVPAGYDGKILEYNSDNRVNIQEKFEMGTYGTKLIVFDPFNCFYQVIKKTSEESKKGTKLAGKDLPTLNEKFDVKSKDNTTRATYYLVDKGTLPTGDVEQQIEKSGEPNFAAEQALNQGIRRYNQLFSGMITATISGDFSLHAGDVIFVDSPGLTTDQDEELNREFGGLYIIASLCHYVSSEETYTKMNLVRDSFGRKGNHTSR